jgi:hypothetical protein
MVLKLYTYAEGKNVFSHLNTQPFPIAAAFSKGLCVFKVSLTEARKQRTKLQRALLCLPYNYSKKAKRPTSTSLIIEESASHLPV